LESWCARGLARRDARPALYLHEYSDSGLTVRGLVGCLDLSRTAHDPGQRQVLPHEGVHPQQVAELAKRMATMRINPAPILLVHHGPASIREVSRQIRTQAPDQTYDDHAGQQHRVWPITDEGHLATIADGLSGARLLVADGHHRYAAYVAMHQRHPSEAHRSGLAMVVDQDETPLFLGAIHRLFHGVKVQDLTQVAAANGAQVRTIDAEEAMAALAPDTLVLTDGHRWATVALSLPPGTAVVQLLDRVLLQGLHRRPPRMTVAHSAAAALEQVRAGRVTAALLPAVDLDFVLGVVSTGALLPEKTTSFQPKPDLGSFIRLLDE
jgi:uncharacterized protein (DUF1015 family)